MVTRPPSTAHNGLTAVMREGGAGVMSVEVFQPGGFQKAWRVRLAPGLGGRPPQGQTHKSGFVELHVPVEVVPPAVGCVAKADRNPDGGCPLGTFRNSDEVHAGFGRRPAALPPVARDAAGDDVLPVFSAALGDRHHMVEGQFRRGEHLAAVPGTSGRRGRRYWRGRTERSRSSA